ncbi:hypothetical protein Tco_0773279 [Tanacetum coccineum]|uniref:Uncharacterized protein n=1 Tax=Tanacetum coccineum TaxID=301880 RepID=A0ABQ4ZKA0_9ASTR
MASSARLGCFDNDRSRASILDPFLPFTFTQPGWPPTNGVSLDFFQFSKIPRGMTARLKEVEIPDPKIVAIRERKARAPLRSEPREKRAAGVRWFEVENQKGVRFSAVRAERRILLRGLFSRSHLRTVVTQSFPFC